MSTSDSPRVTSTEMVSALVSEPIQSHLILIDPEEARARGYVKAVPVLPKLIPNFINVLFHGRPLPRWINYYCNKTKQERAEDRLVEMLQQAGEA